MRDLFNDENSCDVSLICGKGQKLKAHSYVLKACSPIFKTILEDTLTVYLRGIQHDQLKSMLEFMYLGKTILDESNLLEMIQIAQELQIKELGGYAAPNQQTEAEDELENDLDSKAQNTAPIQQQNEPVNDLELENDLDFKGQNKSIQQPNESVEHLENVLDIEIFAQTFMRIENTFEKRPTEHRYPMKKPPPPRKFPCTECEYVAVSKPNLKSHFESIHERVTYTCDKCDAVTSNKSNLLRHRRKAKH